MELTFRQGTADDIPALKSLWKQCFPDDTDSFIDAFFGVVPVTRCLVACKGEPLSMLFLLTATISYKDTTIPVRYLYAGCTHPEHRRQGIYEKLISYAGMYAASAGAAAIYLHPADDSLREYYKMRGYRDGISCPESRLAKAIMPPQTTDSYAASVRDSLLASQKQHTPVWRLDKPYESFFWEEMIVSGWRPMAVEGEYGLLSPDGTRVYDHLTKEDRAEWYPCAMWLPLNNADQLEKMMRGRVAYAAYLGDL